MTMQQLIMESLLELPKLYKTDGKPKEKIVKIFNPYGIGTWHLCEYDPTEQVAFGWCDLGYKELGNVYIPEIFEAIPHIEKDLYFSDSWEEI